VALARAYSPYGESAYNTGTAHTDYGFTGEYTDPSGLIYLRARYYAPYLNQFIQPDTIEPDLRIPADWNKYTYVRNNPISYTDPSGHISIHFQVIVRYALKYNLMPEYTIPSTIPSTPPLWPGQRRGKHIDLADLVNFQIWEVEEYRASGNYPKGHGPGQVKSYLNLLNEDTNKWMPGRQLGVERFASGPYDVNAWWEQPGLIVYQSKLNRERVMVTTTALCLAGLARLIQLYKNAPGFKGLPRHLPPLPEPNPLVPLPPWYVPPIIPVPLIP